MNCAECQSQNAQLRCSSCFITAFCSVQCQAKNWEKEHAVKCDIIGKECHNERDVITLEDIPADHFDFDVGEKRYCFDFEALALWIQSQIMNHPVNPRGDHPNTIRYLVRQYDAEHPFRPANPVTNIKFTDQELLRFADAYEAYLFRHQKKRSELPRIAEIRTVLTIDIYSDNGNDDVWKIADDDYNLWEDSTIASISRNYLQEHSLNELFNLMNLIEVVNEEGNLVEPDLVLLDMSINRNGEVINTDEPELHYLDEYHDIKICFETALSQINEDREIKITQEELEAEMKNGTTTVELRIGYHFY